MVEDFSHDDTEGEDVQESVDEKPEDGNSLDNTSEVVDVNVVEKEMVVDPANELSKMLIGVDMRENPTEAMRVMLRDRLQVFQKYGIQTPQEVYDSAEYDSYHTYIVNFIGKNNITLDYMSREELPSNAPSGVRAFVSNLNTIGVVMPGIEGVPKEIIQENLIAPSLLHETIHVLQNRGEENLSPEKKEYEAYVAANLPETLQMASMMAPQEISDEERVGYISSVSTYSMMQDVISSSLASYFTQGIDTKDIPFMYK